MLWEHIERELIMHNTSLAVTYNAQRSKMCL
jgi:hypothetical protein